MGEEEIEGEERERAEGRRERRRVGSEDRLPFDRDLPGGVAMGGGVGGDIGGGVGAGIGEAWRVTVTVQACDLAKGYLCGSMEAHNVPSTDTSVSQ